MDQTDREAQAALEALAGIARCPGCGVIGAAAWFRGRLEYRCMSLYDQCRIVYFRMDGSYIEMFGDRPEVGPWHTADDKLKEYCGLNTMTQWIDAKNN